LRWIEFSRASVSMAAVSSRRWALSTVRNPLKRHLEAENRASARPGTDDREVAPRRPRLYAAQPPP
jgi:hypothetical protein